jgi:glycolate oxidase FAD binding subunit
VRVARPGPLVRDVLRSPLEPTALHYDGDVLVVVFETVEPAAQAQADALLAVAGAGAGEVTDDPPEGFGDRPWQPGDVAVKVTHRISALDHALDAVRRRLPGCRLRAYAGSGVVEAGWRAEGTDAAAAVAALREDVAGLDGTVVVVDAPDDVKQLLDVWGPVRGLDVMRRVKEQFDPGGRMSPGRFVGGI